MNPTSLFQQRTAQEVCIGTSWLERHVSGVLCGIVCLQCLWLWFSSSSSIGIHFIQSTYVTLHRCFLCLYLLARRSYTAPTLVYCVQHLPRNQLFSSCYISDQLAVFRLLYFAHHCLLTVSVLQCFERLLYIWAMRHPASSYVQGMNDLATPFFVIFLGSHLGKCWNQKPFNIDILVKYSFICKSKVECTVGHMSRHHVTLIWSGTFMKRVAQHAVMKKVQWKRRLLCRFVEHTCHQECLWCCNFLGKRTGLHDSCEFSCWKRQVEYVACMSYSFIFIFIYL